MLAAAETRRRGPRIAIGGAQAVAALAYGTAVAAAGRQDRGSGQRLCRRGEAPGVRPGRHRHARRALGDPGDRRRQHARGMGGDGSLFAGRARRVGAGDAAVARRALPERRAVRDRAAASGNAAARHHRRFARRARRAHRDARSRRGLRRGEPHRARAPRALGARIPRPGCPRSPTRARFSSGAGARRRSAITAPGRTTCCPRRGARGSRRPSACTTFRSARASLRFPRLAPSPWGTSRRCLPPAKASRRTHARPRCGSRNDSGKTRPARDPGAPAPTTSPKPTAW